MSCSFSIVYKNEYDGASLKWKNLRIFGSFSTEHIRPAFSEEVEVIPQHFFRKAQQNEVEQIKAVLNNLNGSLVFSYSHPIYETNFKKDESTGRNKYFNISPDEWRYYVIAFEGNNSKIHDIEHASNLIKNHLDHGITFLKGDTEAMGMLWPGNLQIIYQYHNDPMKYFKEPLAITLEDINLISEYYSLIEKLSADFLFIKKAIAKFNTLKNIPQHSELLILAYFAIIESLITHMPRGNETLDSINHQIVNKMILLRKRLERTLDYSQYFQDVQDEKVIWKKLYSYRSCLAHGNEPNFKKDLKVLKSKDVIFSFIQEVLKLTIIASLREPELISDLRNC